MKNLTIVRHAESVLQDAQYLDKNRPLTKNGRKDALIMSQRIRDAGIKPSKILSSSATRAWETALIIAKTIKGKGVSFMEKSQAECHHKKIDIETLNKIKIINEKTI